MNERIKELAKQVAKEEGWGVEVWQTTFTENFAKLIIQECVRVCNKVYFDDYPDAEDFERSEEGEAIKQHFGVK